MPSPTWKPLQRPILWHLSSKYKLGEHNQQIPVSTLIHNHDLFYSTRILQGVYPLRLREIFISRRRRVRHLVSAHQLHFLALSLAKGEASGRTRTPGSLQRGQSLYTWDTCSTEWASEHPWRIRYCHFQIDIWTHSLPCTPCSPPTCLRTHLAEICTLLKAPY